MPSASDHSEGTVKRLFSRLLKQFGKPPGFRMDPETLRSLNAPAKLFVWQANGETDESQTFATLREAIANMSPNPEDRTFIITESGQIIRPAQIAGLTRLLEATA